MANVKTFLGDAGIYGIGKAIKKLIGVFLLPFYARALSPEEYGTIDVLANAVFFVATFSSIGLNDATARFFYKAETEDAKGEVLFTAISIRLILSTILSLTLLPFADQISYFFFKTSDYKWAVYMSCIFVPISILSEEQSSIYRYYRKAIQFNVLTIAQSLLNIALGIYLVLFLKTGVFGTTLATLGSSAIIVIISFFIFTKAKYTFKFNGPMARQMLKYGFPLIGVGILGWIFSVSDRYFLLYSQSQQTAPRVSRIPVLRWKHSYLKKHRHCGKPQGEPQFPQEVSLL